MYADLLHVFSTGESQRGIELRLATMEAQAIMDAESQTEMAER